MRILLTGATGFLGNNLLRLLLEDNHDVAVIARANSDPRPFEGLQVERVVCDLNDTQEISGIVDRYDLIIHAAAMIQLGWSKLTSSRRLNVQATHELAQAARLKKIRMIHVSTVDALAAGSPDRFATEVDREPSKPACSYVVSKREADTAFQKQIDRGLEGLVVHPGFMVGPWDWKPSSGQMMLAVAKQFTPLAPSGGFSVADVRDVACGIVSAIEHGESGERYILGGINMSYFDLWCKMATVTGSRPPIGKLPPWLNFVAGRCGDFMGRFTKEEPVVNSAATQMGSMFHWYSSEKAERALGYKIGSVDTALEDAWTWFKAHGFA